MEKQIVITLVKGAIDVISIEKRKNIKPNEKTVYVRLMVKK